MKNKQIDMALYLLNIPEVVEAYSQEFLKNLEHDILTLKPKLVIDVSIIFLKFYHFYFFHMFFKIIFNLIFLAIK